MGKGSEVHDDVFTIKYEFAPHCSHWQVFEMLEQFADGDESFRSDCTMVKDAFKPKVVLSPMIKGKIDEAKQQIDDVVDDSDADRCHNPNYQHLLLALSSTTLHTLLFMFSLQCDLLLKINLIVKIQFTLQAATPSPHGLLVDGSHSKAWFTYISHRLHGKA